MPYTAVEIHLTELEHVRQRHVDAAAGDVVALRIGLPHGEALIQLGEHRAEQVLAQPFAGGLLQHASGQIRIGGGIAEFRAGFPLHAAGEHIRHVIRCAGACPAILVHQVRMVESAGHRQQMTQRDSPELRLRIVRHILGEGVDQSVVQGQQPFLHGHADAGDGIALGMRIDVACQTRREPVLLDDAVAVRNRHSLNRQMFLFRIPDELMKHVDLAHCRSFDEASSLYPVAVIVIVRMRIVAQ